ncbi:MAG: heavy metal translocating P-type ATPase metal-binding domain-containing protein [Undibacterium sp.]|nr:heavy metal translocating P-type ATPase metal-binding domain-containing protein [Opitutaceae bacterium]
MNADPSLSEVGRVVPRAPVRRLNTDNPESASGTPRSGSKPICKHCGAPLLDARMVEAGFCCAGCSYVYRIVHEQGLAGYYRIKDEITTPADAAVFQPRDYAWLETAQRAEECRAESPNPADRGAKAVPNRRGSATPPYRSAVPELTLDLQGVSCAGCVWLIERLFQQQAGARQIVANAQLGTVRLRWVRGEFSAAGFARALQGFGYLVGPLGEKRGEPESRALAKRIGLCAAFAMNVGLFTFPVYFGMTRDFEYARLFGLLSLAFGTLSLLVGGEYFIGRAVRALRLGAMHIDLPIGLGIAGAYAGSLYGWLAGEERLVYFDFVSGFILLMLIGRWAQVAAVERNQRRLLAMQPERPRVMTDDAGEVAPEALRVGQDFALAPGRMNPVEAQLGAAAANFSLASINGEAEPRVFGSGARVPAGAVNVGHAAERLTARQTWSEAVLAQLLQAPERAGARDGLIERIVRGYIIGILGVASLAGLGWWIGTGEALRTGAVVTAVLVVSCPCAVALAFPLADEMATVALRRRGVFVREGDLWTKLGRVRQIVFDKTGTLTLETPVLQNPEALRGLEPDARAALHALVRANPHPVSQALLENLLAEGASEPLAGEVREEVGYGVELGRWSLGRTGWRVKSAGITCNVLYYKRVAGGATVLACEGRAVAEFHFADTVRMDARAEVAALRRRGFAVQILSGDRREKVAALADELGLPAECALGELTPQEKAAWFAGERGEQSLMLGDGANDSLAFDRALCRGTPVIHRGLLEQKADFYYLGRGIGGIRALFEVDAVRRRTQRVILVFSIVYNLLAVGLAVAGRMNPLVAAILMPVNSLATLAIVTGGMRRVFAQRAEPAAS